MKIRTGFVSNSSSCSFLIYGITIDDPSKLPVFAGKSEEDEGWDSYEDMDQMAEKAGLEMWYPEGFVGYYLGRSWAKVKDDQTGKQFKEEVEADIKKATGLSEVKCETFEEAWRDG